MLESIGYLSKGVFCAVLIWLGHVSTRLKLEGKKFAGKGDFAASSRF
jgi:hypothetical protein